MTRTFRLAVLAAVAAALSGCLPIMFDRDGNWRGQQPIGPAFGSALQPDAAVPPVTELTPAEDEPAAEIPAEGTDEPPAQ